MFSESSFLFVCLPPSLPVSPFSFSDFFALRSLLPFLPSFISLSRIAFLSLTLSSLPFLFALFSFHLRASPFSPLGVLLFAPVLSSPFSLLSCVSFYLVCLCVRLCICLELPFCLSLSLCVSPAVSVYPFHFPFLLSSSRRSPCISAACVCKSRGAALHCSHPGRATVGLHCNIGGFANLGRAKEQQGTFRPTCSRAT